jgi:hypothetical protein
LGSAELTHRFCLCEPRRVLALRKRCA